VNTIGSARSGARLRSALIAHFERHESALDETPAAGCT
jgi:hypothetical protein